MPENDLKRKSIFARRPKSGLTKYNWKQLNYKQNFQTGKPFPNEGYEVAFKVPALTGSPTM